MKKIIPLILLFVICNISLAQSGKANDDYKNAVIRYLKVSNSIKSFDTIIKDLFGTMRKVNNTIPEKMWDIMTEEFSNISDEEYSEFFGELYKNFLTTSDLNEISDFFETPVGIKYATALEKISGKKEEASKKLAEKIIKRVMERYYEE